MRPSSDRWSVLEYGARFTVDTLARYLIHDPVHHLYDVGVPIDPARGSAP
jgi:hypothetical protein